MTAPIKAQVISACLVNHVDFLTTADRHAFFLSRQIYWLLPLLMGVS